MGPKNPPKRKTTQEGVKDTQIDVTKTPEKSEQRPDGHFSTPKKSKLNLDFWGKQPSSIDGSVASSSSSQVNRDDSGVVADRPAQEITKLVDLKAGSFLNAAVEVRVTFKSPKKLRKIGLMFDFHGMDKTGEVAFVCYPQTVEKFFVLIQVNSVYRIENFIVSEENPRFPSGAGSGTLQVSLKPSTVVTKLIDLGSIIDIPFKFINLDQLDNYSVGHQTDISGILIGVMDIEKVKSMSGEERIKREIGVTDRSKSTISVTLWGTMAEEFSAALYSPIIIRKSCISEWQGKKSLTAYSHTLIWINPDIEEAQETKRWFDSQKEDAVNQCSE